MLEALCLCESIPALKTRGRYVFVRHVQERHKTTNSARLAQAALVGSQLSEFSSRTQPLAPEPHIDPNSPLYLLYPGSPGEACSPEAVAASKVPPTVVILDGTWAQTRKMKKALRFLDAARLVALPDVAHSRLSLREETYEGGLMTLDAVAWLLGVVEGEDVGAALYRLLHTFVGRTLASRGTPLPGGLRWTKEGLVEATTEP